MCVSFSKEIAAPQHDLREFGGLWWRGLQSRIVSEITASNVRTSVCVQHVPKSCSSLGYPLSSPPSLLSETSELVYCVADLQMCNQKLEEEVRKLKQVVEGMEDANQKLAEENEELRNQARV